jgi:hypothetical protein
MRHTRLLLQRPTWRPHRHLGYDTARQQHVRRCGPGRHLGHLAAARRRTADLLLPDTRRGRISDLLRTSPAAHPGIPPLTPIQFLRPRWKGLYAARKKQNDLATALPELPDSFFGWIVPLWRITDEQVLASAGLDAYVYLAFFKMAIKFLLVTLFFALAVIKPVHDTHQEGKKSPLPDKPDKPDKKAFQHLEARGGLMALVADYDYYTDYLWMYLVFVYLFTGLIMYLVVSETRRVIDIRQRYLGSQTTITDRTIRLSGIPADLRSEDKIKDFIEDLGIGKVDSVTLCRNWKELDSKVLERETIVRKLEEAWTVHLGTKRIGRSLAMAKQTSCWATRRDIQPALPRMLDNARRRRSGMVASS